MTHNAEPEAVDLLLEAERLDLLPPACDDKSAGRAAAYLVSCCRCACFFVCRVRFFF